MPDYKIAGAVGKSSIRWVPNLARDQDTIAYLLKCVPSQEGGIKETAREISFGGFQNGVQNNVLTTLISDFQFIQRGKGQVTLMDGIVDPEGRTLKSLNRLKQEDPGLILPPPIDPIPPPSGVIFDEEGTWNIIGVYSATEKASEAAPSAAKIVIERAKDLVKDILKKFPITPEAELTVIRVSDPKKKKMLIVGVGLGVSIGLKELIPAKLLKDISNLSKMPTPRMIRDILSPLGSARVARGQIIKNPFSNLGFDPSIVTESDLVVRRIGINNINLYEIKVGFFAGGGAGLIFFQPLITPLQALSVPNVIDSQALGGFGQLNMDYKLEAKFRSINMFYTHIVPDPDQS